MKVAVLRSGVGGKLEGFLHSPRSSFADNGRGSDWVLKATGLSSTLEASSDGRWRFGFWSLVVSSTCWRAAGATELEVEEESRRVTSLENTEEKVELKVLEVDAFWILRYPTGTFGGPDSSDAASVAEFCDGSSI